jgi:hypothetical protein
VITQADIQEIEKKISPLLGKRGWGAGLGYGSFITVEFGDPIPSQQQKKSRGEWHLWIYCCVWYIEKDNKLLAASEDPRPKLEAAVQYLDNRILHSVKLLPPAFETVFTFDEGIILHLFPVYSEEYEHWKLYTPNGNVLLIGPGTSWSYENSSAIPPQ